MGGLNTLVTDLRSNSRRIQTWFWALPLWKRSILTSVIGAFSGSIFLSFINRYALYYYAYRHQFRIPVEGVEYLDLAIALLSFAIIILSVGGTIIIYYGIAALSAFIASVIEKIKDSSRGRKRNLAKVIQLVLSIIGVVATTLGGILDVIPNFLELLGVEENIGSRVTSTTLFGAIFAFASIAVLLVVISSFLSSDRSKKIFTLGLVLSGILFLTSLMFHQPFYSTFLANIRYGGEVPVSIEYRKADNTEDIVSGKLLLKTTNGVVLQVEDSTIQEIPLERISRQIFSNK